MGDGAIIWRPGPALVKGWNGADLALSERVIDTDIWRGPLYLARISSLLRGTFGTGDRLGWVCTGSTVTAEKQGIGTLKITWEPGGPYADPQFLPLDDWRDETVELYPKVERNIHMYGNSYPGNPYDCISNDSISMAYQSAHGATQPARDYAAKWISGLALRTSPPPTGTTWEDQSNWANQLESWLIHGHETYYMAGIKATYVRHYFNMPLISRGGIIQSPLWGPHAGDTTMSWLRLADAPEPAGVNGSCIRVTYTWIGGPNGHWDEVLYAPKV